MQHDFFYIKTAKQTSKISLNNVVLLNKFKPMSNYDFDTNKIEFYVKKVF